MLIPATIGLTVALVVLCIWDIRTQRLPDWLTLPLLAAGLLLVSLSGPTTLLLHVSAALGGYLAFWAIACGYRLVRKKAGLGLGDAKLLAAAGAWLGPFALPPLVLIAATSALVTVGAMAVAGRNVAAHTAIAFGPFLCFGFLLLWCVQLAGWTFW